MKWIAIAVSLIMSVDMAQAQEATESVPVTEQGAVNEYEPSTELAAALGYVLPEYECEAPNQSAISSSPISRQRYERRWENFNICRGRYIEVLQSDFVALQAAGEDAWFEAQQITLNEHLTSINDRAGEIMEDPYMSDEDQGPIAIEAPRDMPQGEMGTGYPY